MIEIFRFIYVGLAGLELGFISILFFFRLKLYLETRKRIDLGFELMNGSMILYLTGTLIGFATNPHKPFTIASVLIFAATLALIGATYLISTSPMGVRQVLSQRDETVHRHHHD